MATGQHDKQIELLETVRKKRYALEARLRKESFKSIADHLGVSAHTVSSWVDEMTVTMLPQDKIEALRAQEAYSLDESEKRIYAMLEMTAEAANARKQDGLPFGHQLELMARLEDQLDKVRKQRAQLLGLNVPVQVKHNITVRTEFDAEVEALCSDLLGGGNVMSTPDMVDTGEEQ